MITPLQRAVAIAQRRVARGEPARVFAGERHVVDPQPALFATFNVPQINLPVAYVLPATHPAPQDTVEVKIS